MFDKKIILLVLGFITTMLFAIGMSADIKENYASGLCNGFKAISSPVAVSCTTGKEYPVRKSPANLLQYGTVVSAPAYQANANLNLRFSNVQFPPGHNLRPAPLSMQAVPNEPVLNSQTKTAPVLTMHSLENYDNEKTAEYYDQSVSKESFENLSDKKITKEADYWNAVNKIKESQEGVIMPPKCMDVLLDDGSKDQVYITNRYMYSNLKSGKRQNAVSCPVRGDLHPTPTTGNNNMWTSRQQYQPAQYVNSGALDVIGGISCDAANSKYVFKALYGEQQGFVGGSKISKDAQDILLNQQSLQYSPMQMAATYTLDSNDVGHFQRAMESGESGQMAALKQLQNLA